MSGSLPPMVVERTAEFLTRAFLSDPLFEHAQPQDQRRRRGLPAVFSAVIRDSACRGGVHLTPGAAFAWVPVANLHANLVELLRRGYGKIPLRLGLAATHRLHVHEAWGHGRVGAHAASGAVYVSCIGVDPELAGHGVGSDLVTTALSHLGASYDQCVLRTEQPRNVRFYEKLGFRCVEHSTCPESGLPSWFFVKPIAPPNRLCNASSSSAAP